MREKGNCTSLLNPPIFKDLNPEKSSYLFEHIKNKINWPELTKTQTDFTNIINSLNQSNIRNTFINDFMPHFQKIIHSAKDFNSILPYLNNNQKTEIYRNLRNIILSTIHNINDFKETWKQAGHPELQNAFLNDFAPSLNKIISHAHGFYHIIRSLSLDNNQTMNTYRQLKNTIFKSITNTQGFFDFLEYASTFGARDEVINDFKPNLLKIINSVHDFFKLFPYINPEQKTAFYQNNLTELVKTSFDLRDLILKHKHNILEAEPLYECIIHLLPKMNCASQLSILCDNELKFNLQQKTNICEALKNDWKNIIKNVKHLSQTLDLFSEHALLICENIPNLSQLITSPDHANVFSKNKKIKIFNSLLIQILDDFILNKSSARNFSRFNFLAHSREDTVVAIATLKSAILTGSAIEQNHIAVLLKSDAGKTIQKYLSIFRPDVTLQQFLNEKRVPTQGYRLEAKH